MPRRSLWFIHRQHRRRVPGDFFRDESASGNARLALPLGALFAVILGWLSLG